MFKLLAVSSYDGYMLYIIVMALMIPVLILSIIASVSVNTTFSKYSKVSAGTGMTAAEVARRVLDSEGLQHVTISRVGGNLTDNFNPSTNVLSLSSTVHDSTSVAALGVACHEAGHAIQHAKKYFFSTIRIKLVPVLNFANTLLWPLFIIGMFLGFLGSATFIGNICIYAGLIIFGASLLFSLVTLPTEFNASSRAMKVLKRDYLTGAEAKGAKKVLTAAAMTYIVSFMLTALQFLRLLAIFFMNRRDR